MNYFGGNWTDVKMKIIIEYAKAYLTIMNTQKWAKTLYFDGFAGSGYIENEAIGEKQIGTALRILDIIKPKPFDIYYFVDLDKKKQESLNKIVQKNYFGRNANVVWADCNEKIVAMAGFLKDKKNKNFRALAFIDPYGMSVNWSSIESLKDLGIDLWILVPTGMGVNRMLKKDGNISASWIKKLEAFLGLSKQEIEDHFYKKSTQATLFGDHEVITKEKDSVQKAGELYKMRLKTVFKYVSESFVMRNNTNSIMYHFMMATNNTSALKIANEVIKPNYKL